MYNIELQRINLQNAQTEVLRVCENICDSFKLEEQFGVISFGMHELVSLLERSSEDQDALFTINFYIQNDRISVQVLNHTGLGDVAGWIANAQLEDADSTAFTVKNLTDSCELRNDSRELWLDMMVTPTLNVIDRSGILQQEAIRKEAESRKF